VKEHYNEIKKVYDDFQSFLLKQGKLLYRDTSVGIWGPSVKDELFNLFQKIGLSKYRSFIDLGSGDGRVVMIASLFTNATGIEFDPWLNKVSNHIKDKLSHVADTKRTRFIEGDYNKHDIRHYDCVFISPDQPMHRGLEDKLFREVNGTVVVYGPHFHPTNLKKILQIDVGDTPVTVFRRV